MTEARWPDGCPREGHLLDGICVMTKVETLPMPRLEPPEDDEREGNAT